MTKQRRGRKAGLSGDGGEEAGGVDGFAEEFGLRAVAFRMVEESFGGDEDDFDAGVAAAEIEAEGVAEHAGEADIEEDDVGGEGFHDGASVFGTVGDLDFVASGTHEGGEGFAGEAVVFDDEDVPHDASHKRRGRFYCCKGHSSGRWG